MDINQQAEYLANTYADTILRLSYTYLKNTQDAQDICQTVFLKLLTTPKHFQSAEHERAYIMRMTANACKDVLKSASRKKICSLDTAVDIAAPQEPFGEVLSAVDRLPQKYRTVIYLFYYEGYTAPEIAKILGIPTATVHTRLARGRAKLKPYLEEYGYE